MKKLGLVGGMGPESTILYYHDIVYEVQEKLGKDIFPNVTIESINVFKVLKYCKEKEYEKLVDYLMKAINNLVASGADFIALTANTPHIVFEELKKKSQVPLISIVETTCKDVKGHNIKNVGLLGTIFTMEEKFFKVPFTKDNINIIIPNSMERKYINEKISKELELGIIKKETHLEFMKIIKRMREQDKIEGIILGCTELPLLFNNIEMDIKVFDTMKIHIDILIDMIISDKK